MRLRIFAAAAASLAVAATLTVALPALAGTKSGAQPGAGAAGHGGKHPSGVSPLALAFARQVLPPNDGWAAAGPGTTGGSAATPDQVHVVSSRAELIDALGGDNATNRNNDTSKIIIVKGTIDGFEGPDGEILSCTDLADPEYSLEAYLATYDPEVWGRVDPEGPLEEARVRSVANQTRQTQINVGSNTTIIGLRGATLRGLTLMVDRVSNVIVRNLTFSDAHDCFPAWSPDDGDAGNWNSQFDMMSVRRSENVWVDHNTFTDGDNPDSELPIYFGRPFQVHDGALDITHTASLVTVSYNRFTNHDKVMLIGSTNNPGSGDPGRLNVTVHHNVFDDNIQRLPRVRFGQVDVYNNYYRITQADVFQYAIGVGVFAAVYAENNYVALGADVPVDSVVFDWRGTQPGAMTEIGSLVQVGHRLPRPVSLLDEYNRTHDPDIDTDAGWTPVHRAGPAHPAVAVPILTLFAGSGRLPI